MKPIQFTFKELKERNERLNINSVLIQIRYCNWGGHPRDNRLWEAIVAVPGDGLERNHGWGYDTKEHLIEECKKYGYEYEVLRYKRNGKIEIVESSILNKNQNSETDKI